jgi:hypothetical protein
VGERVVQPTDEEACMPDRDDETPEPDRDDETPESDHERAEELAREATEENPDPVTYREVLEGELEEEGLSEEGGEIGEAIE